MKLRLLFSTLFCLTVFLGYGQITTVGLIGDATPGQWDDDTDMVQDAVDTALWTLDITLTAGAAKFRANDAWDVNWGSADFPSGIGTQGGDNIPVFAGDYTVSFNSVTGEYSFEVKSRVGIIGDATPAGWDNDINMYRDTTDHGFFIVLDLTEANAKFRRDDDWARNWGSLDFPSGIGTQGGDNIAVSPAGKYMITLDTMTGAYDFSSIIEYTNISLVGDATPGGWDNDTDLEQDSGNPDLWKGKVTLVDGELKFRANHEWATSWGGGVFPNDTATIGGGNIAATTGEYLVDFNTATGEYHFLIIEKFNTIGLIGDATPGGWAMESELTQDAGDSAVWKTRLVLTDGEAKFRANMDWGINWGSGDFPSGTGVQEGANIPVVAGEYKISLNTITGEYIFEEVVVFQTVGIIGTATPDQWDSDVDMNRDAVDEHLWTLSSMELTDGEAKFRAEDEWTINWGSDTWPAGVGTQGGPNIPVTAGTYSISINTNSGDYLFTDPVGTNDIVLNPSMVKVFPNPAKSWLNIDMSEMALEGEMNISIFDINGKSIISQKMNSAKSAQINIERLQKGTYILQITNDKFIIGKHFSVIQ